MPDPTLLDDCVHCGFCLPACPTYALWHEEMDSPRGRIVLMGEAGTSAQLVEHIDNCLGCMACVTACPSGVQYDKLIVEERAEIERAHRRTLLDRLKRRAAFGVLPHPRRLRALVPLLPLGRLIPNLPVPRVRLRQPAPPVHTPAVGERRGSIALLQGCVQRAWFGRVNAASARLLAAEGWEVHAPALPRCCGALMQHAGVEDAAVAQAKATIAALEGHDLVIANAAGCGSGMREYAHLLREDPEWAGRATAFSARVRDILEVLDPATPRRRRELVVAYHDACHLAHAQGVREPPRALLRAVPGLTLLEAAPHPGDACCGSAGIYNLIRPQPAAELGRRRAAALRETGADVVAAANPGCIVQLQAHLDVPVVHPVELL